MKIKTIKKCKDCKKTKPSSEFYTKIRSYKGESIKYLRARCKPCELKYNRKTDPLTKSERRKRARETYARDRDRIRSMKNACESTRRARKILATPSWADITKIAQVFDLAKKMSVEQGKNYEVDHVIPLNNKRVCGLHVENNLQIITRDLNRKKYNKFKIE